MDNIKIVETFCVTFFRLVCRRKFQRTDYGADHKAYSLITEMQILAYVLGTANLMLRSFFQKSCLFKAYYL